MKSGLEVNSISHFYDKHQSLDQVSLHVDAGSVHCLLGASGSGKSTLLRIIAGLEIPITGEIKVNGVTLFDDSTNKLPENRPVGLVFQQYALFPHLTVGANIGYGIRHLNRAQRSEMVDKYLQLIELQDRRDTMPHELSGGEQQRVALARALCCEPQVMLLDEPFSNLDSRLRADLRELTLRLLKDAGVATLLVTHDPQEAFAVSESMTIIESGKVIRSGNVKDLYYQPDSLQVANIFGPINSFTSHRLYAAVPPLSGEITNLAGQTEEGTMLLRPELIRLRIPNGDANATVKKSVNEGSTSLLLIELDNQLDLFARTLNPVPFVIGDRVYASFS
ncbi:MAG: hypothetical protein CMJ82_12165 [Planctomycetaceae bacterium]|nr:hypothetical protein [Planctomycetaceae bacterium]